jgi:hypothetical protein
VPLMHSNDMVQGLHAVLLSVLSVCARTDRARYACMTLQLPCLTAHTKPHLARSCAPGSSWSSLLFFASLACQWLGVDA